MRRFIFVLAYPISSILYLRKIQRSGTFVKGQLHGQGKLSFIDDIHANTYLHWTGEFTHGFFYQGKCKRRFRKGDIYEGDMMRTYSKLSRKVDFSKHGYGRHTYPESSSQDYYEGEYRNDVTIKGTAVFKSGNHISTQSVLNKK